MEPNEPLNMEEPQNTDPDVAEEPQNTEMDVAVEPKDTETDVVVEPDENTKPDVAKEPETDATDTVPDKVEPLTLAMIASLVMTCLTACARATLLSLNVILGRNYTAYNVNPIGVLCEYNPEGSSDPLPIGIITVSQREKYLFLLAERADPKTLEMIRNVCFLEGVFGLPAKDPSDPEAQDRPRIFPVPVLITLDSSTSPKNAIRVDGETGKANLQKLPVYICDFLSLPEKKRKSSAFASLVPLRGLETIWNGITNEDPVKIRKLVSEIGSAIEDVAIQHCLMKENLEILNDKSVHLFESAILIDPETVPEIVGQQTDGEAHKKSDEKKKKHSLQKHIRKDYVRRLKENLGEITLLRCRLSNNFISENRISEGSLEKSPFPQGIDPEVAVHDMYNNVFLDLFTFSRWLHELYQTLHPEDTTTTADDLILDMLSSVVVNEPYNDLSFTAGGRLMILVEAQSTWSNNILIRMPIYYFDILQEYLRATKQNLLNKKPVKIPKPEFYVIYTGEMDDLPKDFLENPRLAVQFYGDDADDYETYFLDARVKVITVENVTKGSVVEQYIRFSTLYKEEKAKVPMTRDNLLDFIEKCIKKGILVDYLNYRKEEVVKMYRTISAQELAVRAYGREQREEGWQEGRQEGHEETALEMIKDGVSTDKIAKYTHLSVETIEVLRRTKVPTVFKDPFAAPTRAKRMEGI